MSLNPYTSLGNAVGSSPAIDLAQRLAAWHDAMVLHQRRSGAFRGRSCDHGCPHAQAGALWVEALDVYGERAHGLGFLRTHGELGLRRAARSAAEGPGMTSAGR
jgi:hypothetical protein